MSWVETLSPSFAARHEERDSDDVVELLELLEGTRERLGGVFATPADETTVIVHGSDAALAFAQPLLLVARRLTAPAARRYMVGWVGRGEIHVLAPRVLREHASNVPGSQEMALLAPAALYTQLVIGATNRRLPPPFTPRTLARHRRWAWLSGGAAQWFSGQTQHARPAIARRLREGGRPAFPPGLRDATLLGGSLIDLLASEEGEAAAVRLASTPPPRRPRDVLVDAFGGRPLHRTEDAWRSHLERLAEP